jgi:hypothetical protein
MDMKRENFLPMMEPLDPQRPQSGYMQRSMGPESHGDQGIIDRIMFAAKQGAISPEVVNYLMENLLESEQASNQAISRMPSAPNMPHPQNIVPKGLLSR